VDSLELQRALREIAGLRVGPNTADYVAGQLLSPEASAGFFVMGGDARTGRPVRRIITPAMLVEKKQDR
jgi:hypothetical protein